MLKNALANLPTDKRACFMYAVKTGSPYKYVIGKGMLLVNIKIPPAGYKVIEQQGEWTYAERTE